MIDHMNRLKHNNHIIITIGEAKAIEKIQHVFLCKTLSNVVIEETFLNILNAIYAETKATIILNGENLKLFLL